MLNGQFPFRRKKGAHYSHPCSTHHIWSGQQRAEQTKKKTEISRSHSGTYLQSQHSGSRSRLITSFRQAQTTTRQISGQPGLQSKALPQPKHLVNKTYDYKTFKYWHTLKTFQLNTLRNACDSANFRLYWITLAGVCGAGLCRKLLCSVFHSFHPVLIPW